MCDTNTIMRAGHRCVVVAVPRHSLLIASVSGGQRVVSLNAACNALPNSCIYAPCSHLFWAFALLLFSVFTTARAYRSFCISDSTNGVPGNGTCADETSEGSPWSLQELQAFLSDPGNVLPSDYFVFDGYFLIPANESALNLVNIRGAADPNGCEYACCDCVWFEGANFYYDEAPTVDTVVLTGSSHIYFSSLYIENSFTSAANAMSVYHDPDLCSAGISLVASTISGNYGCGAAA